jgi:hypothetical protein
MGRQQHGVVHGPVPSVFNIRAAVFCGGALVLPSGAVAVPCSEYIAAGETTARTRTLDPRDSHFQATFGWLFCCVFSFKRKTVLVFAYGNIYDSSIDNETRSGTK